MSRKYNVNDRIPTEVYGKRLMELSEAITKGKEAIDREFTMRIPAELDRDADIVLLDVKTRLERHECIIRRIFEELQGGGYEPSVVIELERLCKESEIPFDDDY